MKTFEERFTAWVDGRLEGSDLLAFESELASRPEAGPDKAAAHHVGSLLREHLPTPPLKNADFFNHQLLERIRADAAPAVRAKTFRWPIARMAWAGAFCLLIALALYQIIIPRGAERNAPDSPYLAELIDVRAPDPEVYATAIHPQENLTVVWLDGLEYLPETYALK